MKTDKNIKKVKSILRFLCKKKVTACIALALIAGGIAISFAFNKVEKSVMTYVPVKNPEAPIIVLDAGHGGIDGGCSSVNGVPEKGINLNILLTLRDMLEATGYEVDVTRDTDRSIHDDGIEGIANQKSSDMDNRLAIFNKYPNAICISIHQNQFTDEKYSGAQMFYSPSDSRSGGIAQIMQNKFVEFIQPDNKREIKKCGKELFLCHFSKNPTVMIECGFLSNREEAAKLETPEYQKEVAFTIYSGLMEYLSKKK